MFDFLTHLFDTSDFPARWHCGNWTPGHGWLHVLSDLGVWSAYVAIPCVLAYFVLRRKDIPFRTIFLLFGAFILACGTTHLMEALIFWWPAYRLAAVIKLFTAFVSWGTVFALVPVTPLALAMRSPDELEREIAARKQAEEALEQANAELRRQVAALKQADENARRLLEEEAARRAAEQFLATLAHELRNPLAPIRNGLQVLRLASDPAAQEKARAMMDRQLGQLVRLVDDLLDISRISRNRLELRKACIPLAAVIDNAVETARPQIDAKGQALTVTLPPEPIYLDADLTRLAQVFWNLLNNSAKYTDPGGRIELSATRDGDQVVVTVRDTGIGIPPEALPRLFTMFSQVDRSLERAQGGLGIGLALVKGLVDMHGGRVEAHSAGVGQGSTFVVHLPLAAEPPAAATLPAQNHRTETVKRRVLVVDDNRDAAASLAMILSLVGHDTRTAQDGLEALELAEAFRPDVLLLDIGLPKLNGYDACRRIRAQPWGKDIFIVAVTGWGQEEDRRRSQEAGFNHHLVKPVDFGCLEKLLATLKPVKA
jgi:signal transduction histidine kinase/ActR/RegA family two-component response regulator